MDPATTERRLRHVQVGLQIATGVFLLAALLYELAPLIGPLRDFAKQLPFVSNSVVKLFLVAGLCLYAAGNLRDRVALILLFAGAHILSVLAMLIMLVTGADLGRLASIGTGTVTIRAILWGAVALDGALALAALLLYLYTRRLLGGRQRETLDATGSLTSAERLLQVALIGLTILFVGAAVVYEIGPLLPLSRGFFIELPFVSNSVVKVGGLALLCAYIAADIRRRLSLTGLVIAAHGVSAAAMVVFLCAADVSSTVQMLGHSVLLSNMLWGAIALDAVIAVVLLLGYLRAWNARFGLKFLRPMEYRTLLALADALVVEPGATGPSADDVATRIDRHVSQIHVRRRWVYRAALFAIYWHPVLYLKAPFAELDRATRLRHLKKHFQREVNQRSLPDLLRQYVQIVIRIGLQLTYAGYYSDCKSNAETGFIPFSKRERYKTLQIPPPSPPLNVSVPATLQESRIKADVCIIGSGAGGSILAYELLKQGRKVLMLERGKYVQPSQFTEDEVQMVGLLYADGVFQQTQDFRFTVLQGSCVGGSTVVNNAVCFAPPPSVLARWNDPSIGDAGLDLARLNDSVTAISEFLPVKSQEPNNHLNPSGIRYLEGVRALGLTPAQLEATAVRADIKLDCFGCGYCNIGCKYDKKLSMLYRVLPTAQEEFPDRFRIIAECEVDCLRTLSGPLNRVIDAHATLSDGRQLTIEADTFVVSAGAIGSSYLLMQSGIGTQLPVGQHLGFNIGAALTAEFDQPLHAYDGLQISHFGQPAVERGFVYETWWNPPATQAVNMPGWFETHAANMRRYDYLMAVGVLVGSEGNARVKPALTGGPDIAYKPTEGDLYKLGDALLELGKILFAGGAKRVMLDTWGNDEFTSVAELHRHLKRIVLDPSYLTLGTGHPQGGNAMSRDPRRGVVGPDFCVHGFSNLYVCDASVFPSTLTVNPQLTVMSLAHYAAPLLT